MKGTKQFLRNALLLCFSTVLLRTVGILFNAAITKKIGAEGIGLVGLIGSVYSLSITLALSGVHIACSRLTSEMLGKENTGGIRQVVGRCMLYGLFWGVLSGLLLHSLSEEIAVRFLHDSRVIPSLRILAFGLPAISIVSALNGYFNSVHCVAKSVSVQLFEQILRITLSFALLSYVPFSSLEGACTALHSAVLLSEIGSLVYSILLYRFDIRRRIPPTGKSPDSDILSSITKIALPIAFSSYIRSGLVTLEHLLIPLGLRRVGISQQEALSSYGILQGMALPIVLFPHAFLAAFSALLIPDVTESRARGDEAHIDAAYRKSVRLTLWFSIGVSAAMLCFSHELGQILYHEPKAGTYIRMLAPLIPVMYVDTTIDSFLKGMNEQLYAMKVNIADAFISVVLILFLIPRIGIMGYIVTIYVSEILNTSLSLTRLLCVAKFRFPVGKWLALPLLAGIGACTISRLLLNASVILFSCEVPELMIKFTLITLLYILLLFATGAAGRSELNWFRKICQTTERRTALPSGQSAVTQLSDSTSRPAANP